MKLPPDILTELLKGRHFYPDEQDKLRLDTTEVLKFSEILAHLTSILEENQWFPGKFRQHRKGEPVNEGFYVRRASAKEYVVYGQRHSPFNPTVLAGKVKKKFGSAEAAARFWLKAEINLPDRGELDLWKVVDE
jgi:hypothetical protein